MSQAAVRYAEDYQVGQVFDVGEHTFTKEEIVAFARSWDPQPFHIDETFAASNMFGGLIASGWHVALIMMGMMLRSGFCHPKRASDRPAMKASSGCDRSGQETGCRARSR